MKITKLSGFGEMQEETNPHSILELAILLLVYLSQNLAVARWHLSIITLRNGALASSLDGAIIT